MRNKYCSFVVLLLILTSCNHSSSVSELNIDPRTKEARYLRYNAEFNQENLMKAKELFEVVKKENPNSVIATYDLCEYHKLINTTKAVEYCNEALNLTEKKKDSQLTEDEIYTLPYDISSSLCELHISRNEFQVAVAACERQIAALNTMVNNQNKLRDELQNSIRNGRLKEFEEIKIKALLKAAKQRENIIVTKITPICNEQPQNKLCN